MLRALQTKLTPEQIMLECRGCHWFNPKARVWCNRKGKRETGKLGKCLNKKKARF